jgi:hypothetical protein
LASQHGTSHDDLHNSATTSTFAGLPSYYRLRRKCRPYRASSPQDENGKPARLMIACFGVCPAILRVDGIPLPPRNKHDAVPVPYSRVALADDVLAQLHPPVHNFPSPWRSALDSGKAVRLICPVAVTQSSRPISINSRLDCAKNGPHPETKRTALPTRPPLQIGRVWRASMKIGAVKLHDT